MPQPSVGRLIPLPERDGAPERGATPHDVQRSPTSRSGSFWRRSRKPLIAILLLAAAVVALRLTVLAPDPVRVKVAPVARGAVEETITNTRAGTVKTRRRARLSPETGGRVIALPHRKGDQVEQGALLVQLDSSIQKAQVDLAREDVRAAAAKAEEACLAAQLAATEHRRGLELRKSGIASEQSVDRLASEHDRAEAACRAAAATLDQAKAQQRLSGADRARTDLRAPFAGIVAEVNTELGEWITPAPPGIPIPPVVEILDPASLYISAPIDEMDAERVKVGQEVRISVDSRRGEHFSGRLVRVAPYVQDVLQQNRTVEVEAELDDSQVAANVLPGTSADVEVILSRRKDVLQISTAAIAQGESVLVVEGHRLVERRVKTGLRNWRSTEILEGLAEGERVVIARDSPEIKAGARVVVGGER
jgi:HlyD family secretion protein